MSAGVPNYQKLHDMGKLPEEARDKVPGLRQVDDVTKELERIKSLLCDSCIEKINAPVVSGPENIEIEIKLPEDAFSSECKECGKAFVSDSQAKADNKVALHARSHTPKEE